MNIPSDVDIGPEVRIAAFASRYPFQHLGRDICSQVLGGEIICAAHLDHS